MEHPVRMGRRIRPDIAHVMIETSYKTGFKIFGIPFAITGIRCKFKVNFLNMFDGVSPPKNFEWQIIKEGRERGPYDNIYDVNIPNEGDSQNEPFGCTLKESGQHILYIRVPRSDTGEVGFHDEDNNFENNGYYTTVRVYSKREILGTMSKIIGPPIGLISALIGAMRLGLI